jgi:hypothetical protein
MGIEKSWRHREELAAMSAKFDPYYTWLAIPPDEQPPNHYRLLGVPCFEANADVIANAADRQMLHLRTYQSGKHGPLSQRLLNEVSAAKVCLLNAAKKAAYDGQLRQRLASAASPKTPPPLPLPAVSPLAPRETAAFAERKATLPASAVVIDTSRAARRRSRWPLVAALLLLIAAGLFAAFKWGPLGKRQSPETADRPGAAAGESSRKTEAAKKSQPPRSDAGRKSPPAKQTEPPRKPPETEKTGAPPPKTAEPREVPPPKDPPDPDASHVPLVPYEPEEPAKPAEQPAPRPAPAGGTLRVQYKCGDGGREGNQIRFTVQILNDGPAAVPLDELTLRYWYTADNGRPQQYWCDYAKIGSKNVLHEFRKPAQLTATADCRLEITFAPGAGSIPPGESSGDIQCRAAHDDWSNYNFANDYSHDGAKTAFTDWPRITLYRNGKLVWGVEPGAK